MLTLELFDDCKYGRYFCSTDKKWKCRKSPKKSRMDETILNPHDQIEDFYAKMRVLQDLERNPQVDQKVVQQRKLDLKREFERLNENLRDWFGKGKEGGAGGGGWDRYNTKGERIGKCGDKKPGEGKPKCLSKSAAAKLRAKGGKKAIAQAVRRKRREDPNPERKGKAQHVKSLSEGDVVKFPANITRAKELAQQVLYAMIDGDMEKNKKYRIVQRNRQELKKLGYDYTWSKQGPTLVYKPTNLSLPINLPENFAGGKVKGKSHLVERRAVEPDEPGYQHDILTFPQRALVIDTPGELDWYKIGQHYPNLGTEDPHEYGQSETDMVIVPGSDKELEKLKHDLDRLGMNWKEIGGSYEQPEIHDEPKIQETIRKISDSKWRLYSKDGKKNLGTFASLEAAKKHEREVQYFKHMDENFADGKVKGKSRPGRVKQAGASCKGSVTDLRAKAKKYPGEKGKMYHWCANMKAGKK